jgi:hypothetical protein
MTESRVALFVLSPRPVDVRLGARVITSKSWSVGSGGVSSGRVCFGGVMQQQQQDERVMQV